MMNREKMLKWTNNEEDKLFVSKLYDKALLTDRKGYTTYYGFLDPRQQLLLKKLSKELSVSVQLYGGYSEAERKLAAFYNEKPVNEMFPLSVLEIQGRDIRKLSHRDILGSLIGLGIKREKIGDILIGNMIQIIVSDEIAEYLLLHLKKVGKYAVTLNRCNAVTEVPEKNLQEIRDTVQSLRLDAVCASAFGVSRSFAAKLIRQQKVCVNYEMTDDVSYPLIGGETLSAKGYGKVVFEQVLGKSRKDRLIIILKKYI